jgi:ribonuclease D
MSALAARDDLHGQRVVLLNGDLDAHGFKRAARAGLLPWDIETTGLDWRTARIATVQLQVADVAYIVRLGEQVPARLKTLLEDPAVEQVIHHAMFDLRFMAHAWSARPASIACTKIASKLLSPHAPAKEHALSSLVSRWFGVDLDKRQRISDWDAESLSPAQLAYAADDVRYLLALHGRLEQALRVRGLVGLRDRCFEHLPTRVELELGGYPDVYEY